MKIRLNKTWSGNVMTISFGSYDAEGKLTGEACLPIVTDFSSMSEENKTRAWQHGIEQKVGDAAALLKDKKNGQSASVDEKREYAEEVAKRIADPAGTWNLGARGPKTLTPEQELALFMALAAKLGKTVT